MQAIPFVREHLVSFPILGKFAIALATIVCLPPLSRRVRVPDAVGLLLAGVVIGPHGLGLVDQRHPVAAFFAQLGILLLMFFAGLELDLNLFKKARNRAYVFGILTVMLPLLLGAGVGLLFGYPLIPAIVIGSLLGPHTLLGLPIVSHLGLTHLEPITITVGATVIADTLSLVIFGICATAFQAGFSAGSFLLQVLEIVIFVPFILIGVSGIGGWLLKKVENDENAYFILMLAIMTVAGVIAQSIKLPNIVGAFLAGIAVNAAAQDKPAKAKLDFFGNSLFIPVFFVVTGFLINPSTFFAAITGEPGFVVVIVFATLIGKMAASETVGRMFKYPPAVRTTMWSLTVPHVASTLAAALVGYNTLNRAEQRLLDEKLLNIVLVLMLTTAIVGPIVTEHSGARMESESRESR